MVTYFSVLSYTFFYSFQFIFIIFYIQPYLTKTLAHINVFYGREATTACLITVDLSLIQI